MRLGLDIGAMAVKAAFCGNAGEAGTFYKLHNGEPEDVVLELVNSLPASPSSAAVTGSGGRTLASNLGAFYIDPAVALVSASRGHEGIRHIIDIGGGSLSIVDLDEEGRFAGYRSNSLCAAGTGSFLDEQAGRMGISDGERSKKFDIEEPPRIAARCAVFAKSDLIHRQQEGFTIPEMWSGLCRGMVTTAMTTLFRGRRPAGPVLFAGAVAKNPEVVKWLEAELSQDLIVPNDCDVFSAKGALGAARFVKGGLNLGKLKVQTDAGAKSRRPKLSIDMSSYPSFECARSFEDDGNEVRIHGDVLGDVVIGIDIGSTSTKAAVLDIDGKVVADIYRRTSGDPIGATQRIIAALNRAKGDAELRVRGVGTTGSGRKMVGAIIGADRVINEITAHACGALATDPQTETIFEIGGQDAKFIALKNGAPFDSNMNYVCAAGTGSFVEEQAKKLGYKVEEVGGVVMGVRPPYSSDRCTVFMEQDVHNLIRQGFTRAEVMGSVLYSVVQNYLSRVVGRRQYSKKRICFMGATARNQGLVAAFEKQVGAPIAVSPYCHVMGAFGVARIVLNEVVREGLATKFLGMQFSSAKVELMRSECKLCANVCRITHAVVDGMTDEASVPSWGYMCGRDPDDKRARVNEHFEAFRRRNRVWASAGKAEFKAPAEVNVGIPRALLAYSYLPFWRRFFGELGADVILSKPTTGNTIELAAEHIGGEYCYPVKLAHGHVKQLSRDPKVDFIFLPYMVQGEEHDDGWKRSVYCPYNIALPSIIKEAGVVNEGGKPIANPVINFQLDESFTTKRLMQGLFPHMKASHKDVLAAWRSAWREQREYARTVEKLGLDALKKIEDGKRQGVVLLGRPYNVCDLGANLGVPQKIADIGLDVLFVDMLPLKGIKVDPQFNNMYWRYGRKILQAAAFVANHPSMHAVYLTNFGCGPDAFLQSYVEKIMQNKPMLMLEFDEHSADAGYITRLEAFRDVIGKKARRETNGVIPAVFSGNPVIKKTGTGSPLGSSAGMTSLYSCGDDKLTQREPVRTLWLPPLHPYGVHTLAAALRCLGRPAQALPTENVETFEIAKRYCRGTECVPLPSTIGAFLHVLKNSDAPERECLFMPSAKGPCRFGQYHTLQRMVLDAAGYRDTPIESWSDANGRYGHGVREGRAMYNAILAGDLLYKARCRIRPYARDRAAFDSLMKDVFASAIRVIEQGGDVKQMLGLSAARLSAVDRANDRRPLVGIVGEIYVRSNVFTNGNLIEVIEDAGGEAWLAPVSEWFQYLSYLDRMMAGERQEPVASKIKLNLKNFYLTRQESSLAGAMSAVIGDRREPPIKSTLEAGMRVFPKQFDGESIMTVGRAIEFAENGADLIINCAPFGCMPGTLTAGIFQKLEGRLKVPVMSLFFDGEADIEAPVRTYLANLVKAD